MATATTQDSTRSAAPPTGNATPFYVAAASVLAALAYGLPNYARSIYAREHLQFALLIPVGVFFLAMLREEETTNAKTPAPIHGATFVTFLLLLVAAVLCLDALLVASAVSWALALLITSLAFIHFWGGWALFRTVWPLWIFAWLMVPPPFGLDQRLITDLQLWVSKLASYALDSVHVAHVLEGNVVRIEGKDLFVAEACSGINSLFATFVVLIFSMLVLRRSWLHILCLFALGFCCVLAVNVVRVSSLTAMYYYNPKLGAFFDQGVPHFGFGLLCFALLILLVFSMDAMLWLIGSFLVSALPARLARYFSNAPRSSSKRESHAAAPQDERPWFELLKEANQRLRNSSPRGTGLAMAVAVVFGLLAALEYASLGWFLTHPPEVRLNDPSKDPFAPLVGDLSRILPNEWDGWQRVGEKTEHMNFTNAMFSTSWTYQRGPEELTVFLHRKYFDFHGMDVCYAGNGWQVKNLSGEVLNPELAGGTPGSMQIITFDMDKEGEGNYVVAYVNFDYSNLKWVEIPPVYRGLTFEGRIALAVKSRRDALMQLFARPYLPIEIAVILVQQRTTRGAEGDDRKETLERAISASKRAFEPLLGPGQPTASAPVGRQTAIAPTPVAE